MHVFGSAFGFGAYVKALMGFKAFYFFGSVSVRFRRICEMALRAVSHIHRIRTETVMATELHRFVFGRPFTYEPNPWTKSERMPV